MALGLGTILPIALGALGLYNSNKQANAARATQNKALKGQEALDARAIELFDLLKANFDKADASGMFDYNTRVKELENQTADYEKRDLGNTAGALKVMGYRPGDTAATDTLSKVKVGYRKTLDEMRTNLRNSLPFDRARLLQAASPAYLSQPSATNMANLQRGQNMMPDMGSFFSSVMPYVMPQQKKPGQAFNVTYDPNGGGYIG